MHRSMSISRDLLFKATLDDPASTCIFGLMNSRSCWSRSYEVKAFLHITFDRRVGRMGMFPIPFSRRDTSTDRQQDLPCYHVTLIRGQILTGHFKVITHMYRSVLTMETRCSSKFPTFSVFLSYK